MLPPAASMWPAASRATRGKPFAIASPVRPTLTSLRTTTPAGVYRAQPPKAALSASSAAAYTLSLRTSAADYTLSLRTSAHTGVAISDAEQRISWHKKIPTAVCALPRNDGKGVIANQRARRPLCHCEPVRRLVWQSRTRSNVSAGTRRFPRQRHRSLPRNDGRGVIANQCAHWCGNLELPPAPTKQ